MGRREREKKHPSLSLFLLVDSIIRSWSGELFDERRNSLESIIQPPPRYGTRYHCKRSPPLHSPPSLGQESLFSLTLAKRFPHGIPPAVYTPGPESGRGVERGVLQFRRLRNSSLKRSISILSLSLSRIIENRRRIRRGRATMTGESVSLPGESRRF